MTQFHEAAISSLKVGNEHQSIMDVINPNHLQDNKT